METPEQCVKLTEKNKVNNKDNRTMFLGNNTLKMRQMPLIDFNVIVTYRMACSQIYSTKYWKAIKSCFDIHLSITTKNRTTVQ